MPSVNVKDPASFNHSYITLKRNGYKYHYVDQLPEHIDGIKGTCVLLHGFPDLWFGWRYPLVALVEAGYRVIATSQLGYFPSSQPDDLHAYSYKQLSRDLHDLLDEIGVKEQILLFGHDWGGLLAWRFAAYFPRRVKSIAVVSTPYLTPAQKDMPFLPDEVLVERFLPNFGYQLWWKTDEAADILERNMDEFLTPQFSQAPKPAHAASTKSDKAPLTYPGVWRAKMLEIERNRKQGIQFMHIPTQSEDPECFYYLETFQTGGLRKPLKYYKIREICYQEEIDHGLSVRFPASIPVLFIAGDKDTALPLAMSDPSPKYFSTGQYRREVCKGADHWILQDQRFRDAISRRLVGWAGSQLSVSSKL